MYLTFSKIAKKLIKNSLNQCPLCEFKDLNYLIPLHLKSIHNEEIKNVDIIKYNKHLFYFILSMYGIELDKKFVIHEHKLSLIIKNSDREFKCFLGEKL